MYCTCSLDEWQSEIWIVIWTLKQQIKEGKSITGWFKVALSDQDDAEVAEAVRRAVVNRQYVISSRWSHKKHFIWSD